MPRAKKQSAEGAQEQPAQDEGLVLMEKDGDELAIHPTCVKAHENVGWKVVQED